MKSWSEQIANGAVLLTVNQRLARHHQSSYQQWQFAQGHSWWESPQILPVKAWLINLHDRALVSGLATRSLVPDILAQRAWKQSLEQDASAGLLDVQSAAQLAQQGWQLSCNWRCHNDQDQYLSLDQFTWRRWLLRYQQWLDKESFIDDAGLPDELIKLVALPAIQSMLPAKIILDGFLQLTPQLADFFETIEMIGVEIEHPDCSAEAFIHVSCFDDDAAELAGIAAHMRLELEHNPQSSLGLVVPDLQQRRGELLRTFDRVFFPGQSPDQISSLGRPYDLSLGLPLSEQVSVATALKLLELCCSSINGADVSNVLLSAYLSGADTESQQRQRLDRQLRDQRVSSLNLPLLLKYVKKDSRLAKSVADVLEVLCLDATTLSGWAKRFDQWLRLFGWPGKGIGSEEHQAVMAWLECLDDMQVLDTGVSVGVHQAMQELQLLARERIFQPELSSTPIQIMGRLESHGIGFDCLWVAGLDDERWPPSGSPNPFLAITAQKACGIPEASAAARLKLAESEFRLWGSMTPVLFVSHAFAREGKSLRAAQLPELVASTKNHAQAIEYMTRLDALQASVTDAPMHLLNASLQLEESSDEYGPALPAGSKAAGGARLFENQALCPFRAFALHRLFIIPLEEPGLGLDARQHGTALHTALEGFWQLTKTHEALLQLTPEQLSARISDCVLTALENIPLSQELHSLEHTRLTQLILDWVERMEKPRQPFEIQGLEQEHTLEHGGVVMKVILDRIDKVGDSLVVVDYKSGTNNKISSWADERIRNPQLPLYVLTDEAISAAAFAQVAKNQSRFIGVASEPDLLPAVKTSVRLSRSQSATERPLTDWSEWRIHWRSALDEIAAEVRQGLASVTPINGACTFCELKSLCRIDEQVPELEEELMDAEQSTS